MTILESIQPRCLCHYHHVFNHFLLQKTFLLNLNTLVLSIHARNTLDEFRSKRLVKIISTQFVSDKDHSQMLTVFEGAHYQQSTVICVKKKCKKKSFLEGLNCRLLLLHPGHSPTLSMTLNELDNSDPGGQFERIRGTSASNFKILDKATRCHQVSTINIATGETSQVITPFYFFNYFNFYP